MDFNEKVFSLFLVILITIFLLWILQKTFFRNKTENVFDIKQESYYQLHKVTLVVIPIVFSWVLQMWCKDQNEKTNSNKLLIDYVEECKTKGGKDHFKKEEKETVRNESLNEIDVTLLYKIFLYVCKDTIIFKEGEPLGDLESKIREAKELRNKLQHSLPIEATFNRLGDPNELVSCQKLLIDLSELSAKKLNVEKTELTRIIGKIKADIKKIIDSPIINYSSNVLAYHEFKKNLKEKYNNMKFLTDIQDNWLTLHDIHERYHNLKVKRFEKKDKSGKNITSTELYNLFQTENFVFVRGDAGIGKSFFLIQMLREFFHDKEHFHGIRDYDLVIYCQCRNSKKRTIEDLLEIPKFSQNPSWKWKCFIDFLKSYKILFLIDGCDEINDNSYEFIKEIFEYFGNRNFIITGRPGSEEKIEEKVIVLDLEGVIGKENRINFIEKYSPYKSMEILDRINKLPVIIQKLTRIPFYLSCLCLLFNEGQLSNLELPTDFFHQFLKLKKSIFVKRMVTSSSKMNSPEIEIHFDDLMKTLNKIAFNSLKNDRVILTNDDLKGLLTSYNNKFGEENFHKYLSCILSCKNNDLIPPSTEYAFHHKSIQEYCAAKHVQLILGNNKNIIRKFKNKIQFDVSNRVKWENCLLILISIIIKSKIKINEFIKNNEKEIRTFFWRENEPIRTVGETCSVLLYSNFEMIEFIAKICEDKWFINDRELNVLNELIHYKLPTFVLLYIYENEYFQDVLNFLEKIHNRCTFDIWFCKPPSLDYIEKIECQEIVTKVVEFFNNST